MVPKGGNQAPRRRDAQPVSELASALLDPLLARRTGMRLDLVAGWADIVGEDHAACSRPEKLDWPKRTHGNEDGFEPALLVVACQPERAVFLIHESDAMLRRVNAYFGFRAIDRIRIVQRAFSTEPARRERRVPQCPQEKAGRLASILQGVENDELRDRLERLGTAVYDRSR